MKLEFFVGKSGHYLCPIKAKGKNVLLIVNKEFDLKDVPAALAKGEARALPEAEYNGRMSTSVLVGFAGGNTVALEIGKMKVKNSSAVDFDDIEFVD